jgi:3-oxoacyl-[acyl-carrier protein] reductase
MDLGIRGRNAIVCASSRGLGKGCALALAEAGVNLTLNGRDAAILKATAADIRDQYGVDVREVPGDVSDPAVQQALVAASPATDILVNNNGGPPPRPFKDLDRKAIIEGVTSNMITPVELIQAVIDGMSERGFGRIVNITSLSVYQSIPGLDLSSGARAGLTSMIFGPARAAIGSKVTINNLLPGKLDTDRIRSTQEFGAKKAGRSVDQYAADQAREIPAGRLGTAEEFGQICAFLCSVHAGYLTGQNIRVDGGLYSSAF